MLRGRRVERRVEPPALGPDLALLQRQVRRLRQPAGQFDAQAHEFGPLVVEPGGEGRLVGKLAVLHQDAVGAFPRLGEPVRGRILAHRLLATGDGGDMLEVDADGVDLDPHLLAVGDEPGFAAHVDQRAQLAERPAQRRARVVRHLPQQLAQPLAPLRPGAKDEVAEQRARLARGGQRQCLPVPGNRDGTDGLNAERGLGDGDGLGPPWGAAMPLTGAPAGKGHARKITIDARYDVCIHGVVPSCHAHRSDIALRPRPPCAAQTAGGLFSDDPLLLSFGAPLLPPLIWHCAGSNTVFASTILSICENV